MTFNQDHPVQIWNFYYNKIWYKHFAVPETFSGLPGPIMHKNCLHFHYLYNLPLSIESFPDTLYKTKIELKFKMKITKDRQQPKKKTN